MLSEDREGEARREREQIFLRSKGECRYGRDTDGFLSIIWSLFLPFLGGTITSSFIILAYNKYLIQLYMLNECFRQGMIIGLNLLFSNCNMNWIYQGDLLIYRLLGPILSVS